MATPRLASVDGSISPAAEATIGVVDEGLLRGDGVFEVIRLYAGEPYALDEHFRRLQSSASAIELEVDLESFATEVHALLAELGAADGQLRLVATRGGRRIALTEPLAPREASIRVATVTYSPSVILNGVKSLSYAANMQSTRQAQAAGAGEAILVTPDGLVLEAPTASIFWVSPQGALRTPALELGVLGSITRARIVEELKVEEGAWPVEDLRAAQEGFLASTTREVQPLAAIDGRELELSPGPRTEEAAVAFAAARDAALSVST